MTSHSPLLSHVTHTATRSLLASLALAYWLGRGWSPAPHHDTPVRSERGWSHAPGGSVCRAAAEAAARSRSSKRACVAHQQLPSDWSRAALPVLEVVPLASQARSARSARAAGRAPARWPGVRLNAFLLFHWLWQQSGRFSGGMVSPTVVGEVSLGVQLE